MSGGGAAAQTQTVPGTSTTATFTAGTSETAYTFTVQAENKAGKGPVSGPSAPRRAVGKLGSVSSVTATPANTGGNGHQLKIDFTPLTAAQRNGSTAEEVSYTYSASTGQSGAISPGQTVGGFANGTPTTVSVTAHSTRAPSSDPTSAAPATPYGSPGSGNPWTKQAAENQRSIEFGWSSNEAAFDIAETRISFDGGPWETVPNTGQRTINAAGYDEPHTLSMQTFNSIGQGGHINSVTGRSGPQKTQWDTQLVNGPTRNCTDNGSGSSWFGLSGYTHTCDGVTNGWPWLYPGTVITVKCYDVRTVQYQGTDEWYYIVGGSYQGKSYAGRWQVAAGTTIGRSAQSGVPHC
jgi:hypothetical protein